MIVTELLTSDRQSLADLHAVQRNAPELVCPDIGDPSDLGGYCVREGDRIVMAVTGRRAAEAVLLVDPGWSTPRWRLEALSELHGIQEARMRAAGVETVFAFVPPEIGKAYGRRLCRQFGWISPVWPCFVRALPQGPQWD